MFKIFRNNCCGLDVHKTWIYACIGITDPNGRTEYKQARFSSFSKGLSELAAWLAKYSCNEVCMESTGKYWIPVFNILEKSLLCHPGSSQIYQASKLMFLESLHVPLPTISWIILVTPLMSLLLYILSAKHLSLKSRLLLTAPSPPSRLSSCASASHTSTSLKPTAKRSSLKSFRSQNLFLPF